MDFLSAVTRRKGEELFNTPAIISFLPKRLSQSNPGGVRQNMQVSRTGSQCPIT